MFSMQAKSRERPPVWMTTPGRRLHWLQWLQTARGFLLGLAMLASLFVVLATVFGYH